MRFIEVFPKRSPDKLEVDNLILSLDVLATSIIISQDAVCLAPFLVPVAAFACESCGHVNKEFAAAELKQS